MHFLRHVVLKWLVAQPRLIVFRQMLQTKTMLLAAIFFKKTQTTEIFLFDAYSSAEAGAELVLWPVLQKESLT